MLTQTFIYSEIDILYVSTRVNAYFLNITDAHK